MKTAFWTQPDAHRHISPRPHPERPERLDAIQAALQASLLAHVLDRRVSAAADEALLQWCHTPEYIALIRELSQTGGQIDADTYVAPGSFDIALEAVGAATAAIDAVYAGEHANAFVAVRPPGHHATRTRPMGFCLFNTIALAARHAQSKHGARRVAILDWDVHHGNGTQDIFYADDSVFFASVHQSPLYPGSGARHERGSGTAIGTTLNVPLPAGSDDDHYAEAWEQVGEEVRHFAPELILVSAGFDAHRLDPLANMQLSAEGFALMAQMTKSWALDECDGRLICILEGGYDLTGLSESVLATCRVLSEIGGE